ncbi:MAG: SDR family oxidoreductase [Methylacidiphilales bacterium]|nr:SDR family oxidoreductase [Candidatus Methylacidiphilales bacterium]MDW8349968.1 SDR family oxidoreductase [Verrucomicrobiae bacterium]
MSRVALINGGKGDLAQAIAHVLKEKGWGVIHTPGKDELDVRDEDGVRKYFGRIERLDLFIHNAGFIRDHAFLNLNCEDWDAVMAVHLRGGFLCVREALKIMMRQEEGGHVLLIGSNSARSGSFGQSNYAAAKAGLIGLGQAIAREYGQRNVRCNVVLPGYLETKMNRHLRAEIVEAIRRQHVLGRFTTIEESARMIAALAESQHISGQIFQLDSRINPWT